MVVAIVIAILLVTIILASVGVYIVVHNHNAEKAREETSKILLSGKYSVALEPIANLLAEKKPSIAELEKWLNSQELSEEKKNKYLETWQNSINAIIKTVNEGDINEVKAYQIILSEKCGDLCYFLPHDNFITRDQITSNAEILPPYFFGCNCAIVPKLPSSTGKWQAVLPTDGRYEVPDWRQIV